MPASEAKAAPIDITRVSLTIVAGVGGVVALVIAYRRQRDIEQSRFVDASMPRPHISARPTSRSGRPRPRRQRPHQTRDHHGHRTPGTRSLTTALRPRCRAGDRSGCGAMPRREIEASPRLRIPRGCSSTPELGLRPRSACPWVRPQSDRRRCRPSRSTPCVVARSPGGGGHWRHSEDGCGDDLNPSAGFRGDVPSDPLTPEVSARTHFDGHRADRPFGGELGHLCTQAVTPSPPTNTLEPHHVDHC
jgi:hypothetical protein